MEVDMKFSEFKEGQSIHFDHTHKQEHFSEFSKISGDENPLHWDKTYSKNTKFGENIVPLHMTIAPLSKIAGMYFPGIPSLYLGHEIGTVKPVKYDEKLTYSAKIIRINTALRTLNIDVIAFRGKEIVLTAKMTVNSINNEWDIPENFPKPQHVSNNKTAFITGGTGEIGTAFCEYLLKKNYSIVIQCRGSKEKRDKHRENLLSRTNNTSASIEYIGCDLLDDNETNKLLYTLKNRRDIEMFVHASCPPIHAEPEDLYKVNYIAYEKITSTLLPIMLSKQNGMNIFLSSMSTQQLVTGWQHYSASKAASEQYNTLLHKTYENHGVRSITILPGLVSTNFSEEKHIENHSMLPEELVEKTFEKIEKNGDQAFTIEWNHTASGQLGFNSLSHSPKNLNHTVQTNDTTGHPADKIVSSEKSILKDLSSSLELLVRETLKLPETYTLENGGVGITKNWDSLAHISLILAIEDSFSVKFSAQEIEELMKFDNIINNLSDKLAK